MCVRHRRVPPLMDGVTRLGSFWGRVVVDGQTVEYRAFTHPNGAINVGTYYVVP